MVTIIVDPNSPQRRLREVEGAGRPWGRLAGGWVADLAALGKAIVLCGFCARKFRPETMGYRKRRLAPGHDGVIGDCDGCKSPMTPCSLYLNQPDFDWEKDRRRRRRQLTARD